MGLASEGDFGWMDLDYCTSTGWSRVPGLRLPDTNARLVSLSSLMLERRPMMQTTVHSPPKHRAAHAAHGKRVIFRYCAWFVLCLGSFSAVAQSVNSNASTGFWGEIDVGYGILKRSYSVTSNTSESKFSLAFSGGYAWDPRLLLGVELGGWTLEGSNLWDPSKGEAIETVFGIARYYPIPDSPLFVKGGGGLVKYWNNRPSESGASGRGAIAGVGYDVYANGSMRLAPSLEYSFGRFNGATSPPGITQNQRYQAVTVKFGVTFR